MSDARRVAFGPITRGEANRKKIVYGALTIAQFDTLDRLHILGSATIADLATGSRTRKADSILRYMRRYQEAGWVEFSDAPEVWRLTRRGSALIGFAYDHMDTMCSEHSEGE